MVDSEGRVQRYPYSQLKPHELIRVGLCYRRVWPFHLRVAANRTASFTLILELAARGRQEVGKGVLTLPIFRSKPRAEPYRCTTAFKIE